MYTATYLGGKRKSGYRAIQRTDLLVELKGKEVVFLGDAAISCKQEILGAGFSVAHSGIALQRASSVGLVAFSQQDSALTAYDLEPFYLRQTQAEREYAQKHGNTE